MTIGWWDEDEDEFMYECDEDQHEFEWEWSPDKDHTRDAIPDSDDLTDHYKRLFCEHGSLHELAWFLIDGMSGYGLDGHVHVTTEWPYCKDHASTPGYDGFVESALFMAYSIHYEEDITSDEIYLNQTSKNFRPLSREEIT